MVLPEAIKKAVSDKVPRGLDSILDQDFVKAEFYGAIDALKAEIVAEIPPDDENLSKRCEGGI